MNEEEDLDNIIGYWVQDVPYNWGLIFDQKSSMYTYGREYIIPDEKTKHKFDLAQQRINSCDNSIGKYFSSTKHIFDATDLRMNGKKLVLPSLVFRLIDVCNLYQYITSKYARNVCSIELKKENILVSNKDIMYSPQLSIVKEKAKNSLINLPQKLQDLFTLFWYTKIIKENKNKNVKLFIHIDREMIKFRFISHLYTIRVYIKDTNNTTFNITRNKAKYFNKIFNDSTIDYIYIPIGIEYPNNTAHANLLFINKKTKTIELFDPHGKLDSFKIKENNTVQLLVKALTFDHPFYILNTYKFIYSEDICPIYSFQLLDNIENDIKPGDYGGFCLTWSMWFLEMKIKYPDIPTDKLVKKSIHELLVKYGSLRKFIRLYAITMEEYFIEISKKLKLGNILETEVLSPDQIIRIEFYLNVL